MNTKSTQHNQPELKCNATAEKLMNSDRFGKFIASNRKFIGATFISNKPVTFIVCWL